MELLLVSFPKISFQLIDAVNLSSFDPPFSLTAIVCFFHAGLSHGIHCNCSRNCKVYIDIKRSCWKRNPFIKQTSSIFRVPCQWGNMYMLHCYTWENLASCNTCYMCSKKSHNIVTFRIMPFSFYTFCLGEVFTDINGKTTDQVTIYTWLCFVFLWKPTFWCVWCTFGRCLILVNQLQRRRLNPYVCWQTTKVESFVETNTSTEWAIISSGAYFLWRQQHHTVVQHPHFQAYLKKRSPLTSIFRHGKWQFRGQERSRPCVKGAV